VGFRLSKGVGKELNDRVATSPDTPLEIDVHEAQRLLKESPQDTVLIDVREPSEEAICSLGGKLIPLQQIPARIGEIPQDKRVLIHCHHGGRSLRATQYLRAKGYERVSNIAGGIERWSVEIDPSVPRY
jgi:adenylyltransferase/sulfurtransferase